jgi:hypothetical protein
MRYTPRSRIQAALRGELADHVPFTIYWLMLPRGDAERRLRSQGMAVVERVPLYRIEMPNVQVITHEYYEAGVRTLRQTLRTPLGEVFCTKKLDPSYGTSWWDMDYYVKTPDDYRVVEFAVRDSCYCPSYDDFLLAQERLGQDGYVIGNTDYGPMGKMMYHYLGVERFGIDLYDHPDPFFSLYHTIKAKHREMYQVAAASPADMIIYDGNIHQDTMGRRRFEEYYLPCINAFSDAVHEAGKLSACHLDANMRSLVPAVAGSSIDVVEAFTPLPTCDVSVAEARRAWPGKVLWINFPSSVHLQSPDRIRQQTLNLLAEAAPGERFLIGVTEDIPESAWRTSLDAICQTIMEHGGLPLGS